MEHPWCLCVGLVQVRHAGVGSESAVFHVEHSGLVCVVGWVHQWFTWFHPRYALAVGPVLLRFAWSPLGVPVLVWRTVSDSNWLVEARAPFS